MLEWAEFKEACNLGQDGKKKLLSVKDMILQVPGNLNVRWWRLQGPTKCEMVHCVCAGMSECEHRGGPAEAEGRAGTGPGAGGAPAEELAAQAMVITNRGHRVCTCPP